MPAFNQGARIIQMLQQLLDGQQQLRIQVGQLQNQVGDLQNHQQRMPMMLYRASVSDLAPLRYPAGIPIDNVPATRRELTNFTGPQLQVAAGVLGLPALPDNALVDQRMAQIAKYLGIPY
ncbi:Protein of unknown function [Pyronema omphalodes CBS 100304]|uniref:Uncharacterized protein n=1 Tax=Pyronema omphalodes (strain CBS 100304) TaxID=1076935 RepID=U4LGU5_PYROM|nr:Protein of unknown function [Pyronema omphalodes CBS 100304]